MASIVFGRGDSFYELIVLQLYRAERAGSDGILIVRLRVLERPLPGDQGGQTSVRLLICFGWWGRASPGDSRQSHVAYEVKVGPPDS
jgi:hypothetical protein